MNEREPAVLVMAEAPLPGACQRGLEPLLGAQGCAHLQRVLLARASEWALRVAPEAAFAATVPQEHADGETESRRALADAAPAGMNVLDPHAIGGGSSLEATARLIAAQTGRPLVVVAARLPWLGDYHADAVRSDLRDGLDAVLGVAIGGGLYLLALREPQPRLLALLHEPHDGEHTRRLSRAAAAQLSLRVGMLHYERTLSTPADARAMLADPLLPGEVAAALRAAA